MNRKTNRQEKKNRDPLPEHFASLEEAAEFWDTHDSGDYEEYLLSWNASSISEGELISKLSRTARLLRRDENHPSHLVEAVLG